MNFSALNPLLLTVIILYNVFTVDTRHFWRDHIFFLSSLKSLARQDKSSTAQSRLSPSLVGLEVDMYL